MPADPILHLLQKSIPLKLCIALVFLLSAPSLRGFFFFFLFFLFFFPLCFVFLSFFFRFLPSRTPNSRSSSPPSQSHSSWKMHYQRLRQQAMVQHSLYPHPALLAAPQVSTSLLFSFYYYYFFIVTLVATYVSSSDRSFIHHFFIIPAWISLSPTYFLHIWVPLMNKSYIGFFFLSFFFFFFLENGIRKDFITELQALLVIRYQSLRGD